MSKVVALNNGYSPAPQFDERLVNGVSLILADAAAAVVGEVYKANMFTPEEIKSLLSKAAEVAAGRILETYATPATPKRELIAEDGKIILKNSICYIEYQEREKRFSGRDLDDQYNLPAFYNTSKRTHRKAAAALLEQFNENTTMYDAMNILRDNGIKCHSWCSMD